MSDHVFGIDLGTTNSCITAYENGEFKTLSIDGSVLVPSAVAFFQDKWLIGKSALNHTKISPCDGVLSVKRKMGEPNQNINLGDKISNPIEISSKILEYIKNQVKNNYNLEVKDVVITVPAWFNDIQRQATILAGEKAGLNVLRIINEPTAACLAYDGIKNSSEDSEIWAVYDLGGGTFDVSIISTKGDYKEVMSSCGNSYLGGDDFDSLLIDWILNYIRNTYNEDVKDDPLIVNKLRLIALSIKLKLSEEPIVIINDFITYRDKNLKLSFEITVSEFEKMILDLIESTIDKFYQALNEAKLTKESINKLILVGGSTRIPLVKNKLREEFNIIADNFLDVDTSVSLGACVQASLIKGLNFNQIIVDIVPHSLGIATFGEKDVGIMPFEHKKLADPLTFCVLISKNTKLPAKFTKSFYPVSDEQVNVKISVYQGESEYTDQNSFVGSFFANLPEDADSSNPINVCFKYDLNAIVYIEVLDGNNKNVLKDYKMDLKASSVSNTEKETPSKEDKIDPKETTTPINYLIDQVSKLIANLDSSETTEIKKTLDLYKKLLLKEDEDDQIDEIEEKLYNWLDSQKNE